MNILNKLTIQNLKLNKKRTIVTIIGVILSTALICCLAGLISSFQQSFIKAEKEAEGDYHAIIYNVEKDDLKYIANNREVEAYFETEEVGYSKLENSANPAKPYLYILALDSVSYKEIPLKLTQGRFPKNENEVVISETINSNAKQNYKVGDTLTLNIGDRYYNNEKLDQKIGYNDFYDDNGNSIQDAQESFVPKKIKTYKIVGIIERPQDNIEPYHSAGYSVLTYMDTVNSTANVFVRYKNPKGYYAKTTTLSQDGKYEFTHHMDLLRFEGVGFNDITMRMLYTVGIIVLAIIMVASVFVIKNSFSISVTEKIRQYGMLSSIGATSKQIKKSVLFEGIIIGLIGVPLGILAGMLANVILIYVMNYLLKDYLNGISFIFSIPLYAVGISILLAFITIILSCLITSIKAAKISPIEALRNTNEIKIKSKKLRTPKIIKKIFKIGGEISYKNLKRSRKKYRTTLISIVLSIIIFISLSSILYYGFEVTSQYYTNISYNLSANTSLDTQDAVLNELTAISKSEYIDRSAIYKATCLNIDINNYASEYAKNTIFKNSADSNYCINITAIGDDEYNRYLKENKLTVDEDTAILLDAGSYYDTKNKKNLINLLKVKNNDSITGKIYMGTDNESDLTIKTLRTDKVPMGLEFVDNDLFLIVPDSFFETHNEYYVRDLFVHYTDSDKFIKELDEYKNKDANLHYYDLNEQAKMMNSMTLLIKIFLYGFITVISLIGVTNIFNTITTNMTLRRREFATLRAIGMTDNEFNKMIRLESIFYGFKALLIGLPLGIGLSYLLYLAFNEGMIMSYVLPIKMIIICIVFVFLIISLTMRYSLKKINKQNIIETIREENI